MLLCLLAELALEFRVFQPLAAVTPSGVEVDVDRLSQGAADQLWLALRLASVKEAVAGGTSLPFIADALMVNYDDGRAAVGFEVLSKDEALR
ncbi:MAG TPA: hypothetical protein VL356_09820 [Acidocella sp.]|jgi:uncharacterized protein YhaN|nr:hypothetical protein [Acidocella sp.]